jgi:hypothetical protein
MSQEIIFTTLPDGRAEVSGKQYLKLSVFTTIQIKTPGESKLADFEDILNWTDKISSATFKFRTGNGNMIDATLDAGKIDSSLYKSIFHKDIRLKGYLPENFNNIRINSFPAKSIKDYLLKNYLQTAIESPTRLVSAEKFIDEERFGPISRFSIDENELERVKVKSARVQPGKSKLLIRRSGVTDSIVDSGNNLKFTRMPLKIDPHTDFTLFRNFHRTDKWERTTEPLKIKKPEFEFHQITAILSSYPLLMRKLGFILDFTIPYESSYAKTGGISLVPSSIAFEESGTIVSVPSTAYVITDDGFFTEDNDGAIFKRGFVKINTDDFAVIQVDADGAAIKAHNLAENKTKQIAQYFGDKTSSRSFTLQAETEDIKLPEPPEDEGLPSIRSAGIAITKNSMAEHITLGIQRNLDLQKILIDKTPENKVLVPGLILKLPDDKLYSSDVVQGYRMDIAYESDPEKWYSLHFRKDSYSWYDEYSVEHPIDGIDPDEGYIELGLTEDPDDPTDVFVSDTIARWEGWSLSVGKPGFSINHADDSETEPKDGIKRDFVHKTRASEAKKYAFDPDLQFRVNAVSSIVSGTLPKLRFGKDYRIRIRAVDLAGNSLPVTAATTNQDITIQKNIRYLRYEPLASPIVLVGNELRDGEFLERMVIRSNFDQSVSQYEASHTVGGKKMETYSLRYLLPPDNSQAMAETHGMFEKAFTGNPAAAKEIYDLIASHEGKYDREFATVEKVFQPSEAEVIYLPDPMAAGVAFFVADGFETTHSQDFFKPRLFGFFTDEEIKPDGTNSEIPSDWYHAKAVQVRLEEGELSAVWKSTERTLTVFLPKGIRTRIKFSTFWREKDFKQISAYWNMIKEQSPSNIAELERLIITGQHWMLSPSREFELVHATQQPVEEPVLKALIPSRDFDDTTAELNVRLQVHGESTEKVEIQSKWTEQLDDGISVSIKENQGRNSVSDIHINYNDDVVTRGTIPEIPKIELKENPRLMFQPHSELKMRTKNEFRINPQPEATRVGKLFKAQDEGFAILQKTDLAAKKTLVSSLRFDIEASKFSFLRNINLRILPLKQNFGDTKHRWVDYNIQAATRYSEYFAKILAQDSKLPVARESNWIERVNILSTSRPKPPVIDYVIPTFEWIRTQDANTILHRRLGGGLRIYIKRPWFSSGDDEMLAILLPPLQESAPAKVTMAAPRLGYTPYFTNWGLDPLHFSTVPDNFSPAANDFRYGPVKATNVQYPDPTSLRTDIVAYPVQFDQEKQMWFCDIAVNPGKLYYPFIKLALARYQKHSVKKGNDDVSLSPVVFADMMQLVPDRSATLAFKNDETNSRFTLTISGVIYNGIEKGSRSTDNVIKVSFVDTRLAQPVYGLIDDNTTPQKLVDEAYEIPVMPDNITGNRFTVTHDFRLPGEYKKAPFEVVIREFEQIPQTTRNVDRQYNSRIERSAETDKLIYADVFKINSTEQK